MDFNKFKSLEYEEIRSLYKNYLNSLNISTATVNTAFSDSFYLWRKGNANLFWKVILSNDFDNEAKDEIKKLLIRNSKGNINSLTNNYVSHLRRFRMFLHSNKVSDVVQQKNENNVHNSVVNEKNTREIIVNKMYSGTFLTEGDNIGHEIINLYKADNGKNYIYLNPQGTIDSSHFRNNITVLLVRRFAVKTYKVLAKAEGIKILDLADRVLSPEARYERQISMNLKYGGVSLVDIFDKNFYPGVYDNNAFTTFVANKVIEPNREIFITDDETRTKPNTFYIRTSKGFGRISLREFFSEKEKFDSFSDLNQIIENEKLWKKDNTTKEVTELTGLWEDPYFNFLKIIKQEDNELVFTNMLAYFFNINREAFILFCQKILKLNIENNFTVEREKNNIDLLISDTNNVIVIENKIRSSINGISDKYDIYSDLVQSQLNKYYHFVTSNHEYKFKKATCFLFVPNYNQIDLTKFSHGDKYTVVYYKEIYDFFIENSKLFDGYIYFSDFVNAMQKHTKDYDNDLEEEMQRRFQNAIYKIKKTKLPTQVK